MPRHYRRRSRAGNIVRDVVVIANGLPWWGAALLGFVSFVVFYWLLPLWLQTELNELQGNMYKPMVDAIFGRRIHWLHWIGIALGLVGMFFAVRNYHYEQSMKKGDLWGVGLVARWLARFFD